MKIILCSILTVSVVGTLGASLPGPPLAGNYAEIDTNDGTVQEMAAFAAQEMNFRLNGITKAEVQVVAGYNYRMTLSVGSGCLLLSCNVVVWYKPDGTKELTSEECGM